MVLRLRLAVSLLLSLVATIAFAQTASPEAVPGEYIVKYRDQVTSAAVQNKISAKASFKGSIPMKGMYHVQLKPGVSAQDIASDPDVEYIEPNYILHKVDAEPTGTPVEILSESDVSAMSSTTYYQSFAPVQLEQAWQVKSAFNNSNPQNRPIVAIVDTGLDGTHRVITTTNALWTNAMETAGNGVDDDGNGYADDIHGWNFITNTANYADDNGHGTHVGGIILGAGIDILSSSLDPALVRLMPLKFLDSGGSGTTTNAIRAIYYAVDNGARVINCSWGGSAYSRALHDAMKFAYDHEVLVVSAAGNATNNNDASATYPANYDVPSNLAVAATTDSDVLAYFSNYGNTTVPVAAPGYLIYSLYPGNRFATMSGTSMAAPFVAGLAALAIRERPTIKGYQLKETIMDTVDVLGSLSGKVSTRGRVNAFKLLQDISASNFVVSSSQPNYIAVYKAEGSGGSSGSSSGGAAAGCGLVKAVGSDVPPWFGGAAAILILAPLGYAYYLRRRDPANRRKFDRYNLSSSVTVQCGDQVIVGSMKTISLGGMSFNAAAALEKGGSVTIKIDNPGGGEPIEVQGHIVWSAQNQAYGVQFGEVQEGLKSTIQTWCRGLIRAS